MYTDLRARNFRNLADLELKDLRRINLITGKNGAGKTAILEAIYLNTSAGDPNSVPQVNAMRGETFSNFMNDRPFRTLFNNLSSERTIQISGHWLADTKSTTPATRDLTVRPIIASWRYVRLADTHDKFSGIEMDFKGSGQKSSAKFKLQWVEEQIRISTPQEAPTKLPATTTAGLQAAYRLALDPPPQKGMIGSILIQYSPKEAVGFIYNLLVIAAREKNIPRIVDFVRIIDNRVSNLVPLAENNANSVYVDIGLDRLIPLTMMGNGFINILYNAVAIIQLGIKVGIIDEIENGLHYSAYSALASSLISVIRSSDVQLFISTHSGEFIQAFAAVIKAEEFRDICALRISSRRGNALVTRFDAQDMENAKEIDMDLR